MPMFRAFLCVLLVSLASVAGAQTPVPDRQIPPSVLSELNLLENSFDIALAEDCDAERCFTRGCTYVDHAVTDRAAASSMPGLGEEPAPGSAPVQEYLTRARCSFAYEESVEAKDAKALSRRLQAKLSRGWMVVSVVQKKLQPLPEYLGQPPEPEAEPELEEEVVEEPEVIEEVEAPPPWEWWEVAARELWTSLLPHFFWMIGLGLLTLAGASLIWSWRRVGAQSIEEQMLLAEIANGGGFGGDDEDEAEAEAAHAEDSDYVREQREVWTERLAAIDPAESDAEIEALIRELLRAGDMALLAKAVLAFPETFPPAFPAGGDVASAKLELADYLKTVDTDALPDDAEFFRALNRHALSASVATQSDAQIVSSLRDEFGAFGLATLIGTLSARPGALLFALAPADSQHEMVRLLDKGKVAQMALMLLQSNRMDASETAHLFDVLAAARSNEPLAYAAHSGEVTDRGSEFDAVGALSVLLESVNPARRSALFGKTLDRFGGTLPSWHRGILVADMLFELSNEARADLMLGVDAQTLAAWMSLLDGDTVERLMAGLPNTVRAAVFGSSVFPSRDQQLALAAQGRRELAQGFQQQLARAQVPFETVVHPPKTAAP